jgi:hypothetical protein
MTIGVLKEAMINLNRIAKKMARKLTYKNQIYEVTKNQQIQK